MKKEELYILTDILNNVLANYLRGSEAEKVIAKFEDELEKSDLFNKVLVSKDFETEWKRYCDAKGGGAITVNVKKLARHFANWQKQWKPTEDDLECLSDAIHSLSYPSPVLGSLLEQLKKLREE